MKNCIGIIVANIGIDNLGWRDVCWGMSIQLSCKIGFVSLNFHKKLLFFIQLNSLSLSAQNQF